MTPTISPKIGLTRNFAIGVPYWTIMEHSARQRAHELGAALIVRHSSTGPEQAATIHSLIEQRVDAIIVAAIDPDDPEFLAALQRAIAANMPLIAADVPLAIPVSCVIRSDDRRGAAAAARYVADAIGGQGTVIHLQGGMRSPVAQLRSLGVHDVLDSYAGIRLVDTDQGDWTRSLTQPLVRDLLREHPDLRAVIAANDPMALGARDALADAGHQATVVVTGVDGDAEALMALEEGTLAATVQRSPYHMGRTAVEVAVTCSQGTSVPAQLLLDDMRLVTRESVTRAALDTLSIMPGVIDGLMLSSTTLDSERTILRTIIDSLPDVIYIKDRGGRFEVANQAMAQLVGVADPDLLIGKTDFDFLPHDLAAKYHADEQALVETGTAIDNAEEVVLDAQGRQRWLITIKVPIRNHEGRVTRIVGRGQDITERKLAEQERQRLQEQLIQAQAVALRELSTPLLAISDTTLVMPLIGAIDSRRVQQIMETLLTGVSRNRASSVIIDITGVPLVDTQVANALIQATQAVKLLGAEIVLTGIRPEVAQTLVQLGVSLQGMTTRATLRDGIAYTLLR